MPKAKLYTSTPWTNSRTEACAEIARVLTRSCLPAGWAGWQGLWACPEGGRFRADFVFAIPNRGLMVLAVAVAPGPVEGDYDVDTGDQETDAGRARGDLRKRSRAPTERGGRPRDPADRHDGDAPESPRGRRRRAHSRGDALQRGHARAARRPRGDRARSLRRPEACESNAFIDATHALFGENWNPGQKLDVIDEQFDRVLDELKVAGPAPRKARGSTAHRPIGRAHRWEQMSIMRRTEGTAAGGGEGFFPLSFFPLDPVSGAFSFGK